MANMCNNYVTFSGNLKNIDDINWELHNMRQQWEINKEEGVRPSFSFLEDEYFFDLQYDRKRDMWEYTSKWKPNIDALKELAKHYEVDFELHFDELGQQLFGIANYDVANDDLYQIELGKSAFALIDEQDECFVFENRVYDDIMEILDILLQRQEAEILDGIGAETARIEYEELLLKREHYFYEQHRQMVLFQN